MTGCLDILQSLFQFKDKTYSHTFVTVIWKKNGMALEVVDGRAVRGKVAGGLLGFGDEGAKNIT
jgi:hypothetical protein